MFFLENSYSYVNVDLIPQRYGQAYTRRAQSTTDVPVVSVYLITNTISGENVVIPSPSVDIDSQFDLDILIVHRKRKMSCTLHRLHNFLSYAHLFTQYRAFAISVDPILFSILFQMPC